MLILLLIRLFDYMFITIRVVIIKILLYQTFYAVHLERRLYIGNS